MSIRIGLNLLHAMPETPSGWNYIANLLRAFDQNDNGCEYFAFVTEISKKLLPLNSRIKSVHINIKPINRGQRILYENTRLQYLAHHYSLDCMHWFAHTCSILNAVPGVVTIHDLLVFRNPRVFSWIKRFYLVNMMKLTTRSASFLLPVSKFTASELTRFLGVQPDRMIVIPVIIPSEFTRVAESVVEEFVNKYNLPKKFWLYVAHTYTHKNHMRLLEAYNQARIDGLDVWPLVLRGEINDGESDINLAINNLRLGGHIIRLPQIDYTEMPSLYSAATALIFPSLFEGRGIPVLEAMACGCPVACSNIPPLKESAGDAALYFDPIDVKSIYDSIFRFQNDDTFRNELSQMGMEQLFEFRPQKVVADLYLAYQTASQKISR